MDAKVFINAIVVAAIVIGANDVAPASALDQPVAVADIGCGVIVTRAGNLHVAGFGPIGCPRPQNPWALLANVFFSAGRGPGAIVGMNQHGQALAASGEWFQITVDYNYCSSISAAFQGNVIEITGMGAPGEEFVTFGGGSPSGGHEYAVTSYGNVFRWAGCSGWVYLGPMMDDDLPIPATRTS